MPHSVNQYQQAKPYPSIDYEAGLRQPCQTPNHTIAVLTISPKSFQIISSGQSNTRMETTNSILVRLGLAPTQGRVHAGSFQQCKWALATRNLPRLVGFAMSLALTVQTVP